MTQVQSKIAGRTFRLSSAEVERKARNLMPEPLGDHFVVIGGRRYPPKQVISLITGLDRADFNTHQARQVLSRLGFTVGRRAIPDSPRSARSHRGSPRRGEADLLRPYVGQWVAQRGPEVLVAARTPEAVLGWLERYNQVADVMFRVPHDASEAVGVAPA